MFSQKKLIFIGVAVAVFAGPQSILPSLALEDTLKKSIHQELNKERHNKQRRVTIPLEFRIPNDPQFVENCDENHGPQGYIDKAYREFSLANPDKEIVIDHLDDAVFCNTRLASENSSGFDLNLSSGNSSNTPKLLSEVTIESINVFVPEYNSNPEACWPDYIYVDYTEAFSCSDLQTNNQEGSDNINPVASQEDSSNSILPIVVGIIGSLITDVARDQNGQNTQPAPQTSPAPTVASGQSEADRLLNQWGWHRIDCYPQAVFIVGLGEGVVCVDPMPPELPSGQYRYDASINQLMVIQ